MPHDGDVTQIVQAINTLTHVIGILIIFIVPILFWIGIKR